MTNSPQSSSDADRDDLHNWVLWQGTKSAVGFGAAGVALHLLAQRTLPLYRRQTAAFKTFLLLSLPMGAFFTVTDRAAMHADRMLAQKYSVSHAHELMKTKLQTTTTASSLFDRAKAYVQENRYAVVGYGYATAVGTTLLFNFANPRIAFAQKIYNARMLSQAFVIGGLAAIGLLTAGYKEPQTVDPYFERVISDKKSQSSSSESTNDS